PLKGCQFEGNLISFFEFDDEGIVTEYPDRSRRAVHGVSIRSEPWRRLSMYLRTRRVRQTSVLRGRGIAPTMLAMRRVERYVRVGNFEILIRIEDNSTVCSAEEGGHKFRMEWRDGEFVSAGPCTEALAEEPDESASPIPSIALIQA